MTKIDRLYQKINAFTTSEPYPHHPFTFCVTCSSPTHPTQACPYNASNLEYREDLNTFQNFQRPSYNTSYSEPCNLDWARQPNFSWSEGSHLGGPVDFTHYSALHPQYP